MSKTVRVIPAKPKEVKAEAKNDKPLRVAAYCRVSTDEDEQQTSYENQIQYFTQLIEANPNWEMAGVYADATVIIGLKQNPTYGRRFSPIFLFYRAFCGAKRKMLL